MLSTLALIAFLTPQTTWHVDVTGTAPGTGTAADPYTRIDFAVAQAGTLSGDTILVYPGEYLGEAIDFAGKDLHVVSLEGSGLTTLRNTHVSGVVAAPLVTFSGGESPAAILEGFTLDGSGGAQFSTTPDRTGGADLWIDNAFPTLRDCIFTTNGPPANWFGRAVFARSTFPYEAIRFENCELTGNNAGMGMGGAFLMENTAAEFTDCAIASSGGGLAGACVATDCTITMRDCTLSNNITGGSGGHGLFEDCALQFHGCEVTNGFSSFSGAGFVVSDGSLWVTDSQFSGNSAIGAGALQLYEVSTTIEDSTFNNNTSADFDLAGAILQLNGQLHIRNCEFTQNSAGKGGAIAAFDSQGQNGVPDPNVWTHLEDCQLVGNQAVAFKNIQRPSGGAIYAYTTLTVERCTFEFNLAAWLAGNQPGRGAFGGAIYLGAPGQVTDSSFITNRAQADGWAEGGAIYTKDPLELVDCILFDNHVQDALNANGGAIFGEVHAIGCTLRSNSCSSGGHSAMQAGSLTHSIVWDHAAPSLDPGVLTHFSLVEGGAAGPGNVQGDPLFWGPSDHHLMPDSPAIDAGDSNLPGEIDGTLADLGALPFEPLYCGPGCAGPLGSNSCVAVTNSTGQASTLEGLGSPLASDNLFILHAADLPAGMPGYFLSSQGPGFLPGFGGSDGVLCLGPPTLLRFNEHVRWSGVAGQVTQRLELNAFPQKNVVLPGDTWYFQLWHRDYNGVMPTSNTTPALRVDFQ